MSREGAQEGPPQQLELRTKGTHVTHTLIHSLPMKEKL